MSITPDQLFELAEHLHDKASNEASEVASRSSASRAYYAALHAAWAVLPPDLEPSKDARRGQSSHQVVIDAYVLWARQVRPGRGEARIISRNLPRLKQLRKDADYNLSAEFTLELSVDACRLATRTIESVAKVRLELS